MSQDNEASREEPFTGATCTLLILEDGRVLARNVTPSLARLLHTLCPYDASLALRIAGTQDSPQTFPISSPNPS